MQGVKQAVSWYVNATWKKRMQLLKEIKPAKCSISDYEKGNDEFTEILCHLKSSKDGPTKQYARKMFMVKQPRL